ncbi:MAG: hypothetical protein V7767_00825 [Leeuwenhoekiella sp.]
MASTYSHAVWQTPDILIQEQTVNWIAELEFIKEEYRVFEEWL